MAGVKATKEAKRLAEEFVKKYPNHPASIAYKRSLSYQGISGATKARQSAEQGVAPKKRPMTKPLPKTVAAQQRAHPTTKVTKTLPSIRKKK